MNKAYESVKRSRAKLVGTPCRFQQCGKPRNARSSYCDEHYRILERRRLLKRRGVIDADENTVTQLLSSQGDICAICYGRSKRWHLDHDHKTGRVRGVLCNRCNIMLGMALDSPTILECGANYLRKCAIKQDIAQEVL